VPSGSRGPVTTNEDVPSRSETDSELRRTVDRGFSVPSSTSFPSLVIRDYVPVTSQYRRDRHTRRVIWLSVPFVRSMLVEGPTHHHGH